MKLPLTAIIIIIVAVLVVSVLLLFFVKGTDIKWFDSYTLSKKCEKFFGRDMTSSEIESADSEFAKVCRSVYSLEPRECAVKYCGSPTEKDPCKYLCRQLAGLQRPDLCGEFKTAHPDRYASCDCSSVMTLC